MIPDDPMNILFVCTGNTCRSPLAEVIAQREIAQRQLREITVGSAGTSAWPDSAASDGALLVALEHDLDLSAHRARQLSPDMVSRASLILTMGPHHLDRAEALGATGRSWLLTAYAGGATRAISDPFGGTLEGYRATFDELSIEIAAIFDRLAAGQRDGAP